jgi:tRNA nucleotidyltransferase (CCA-adding enzyme)
MLAAMQRMLATRPPLTLKDLAVNGRDLIAGGIKPGPHMGKLLQKLLDRVVEDPAANTRDALLALAKEST